MFQHSFSKSLHLLIKLESWNLGLAGDKVVCNKYRPQTSPNLLKVTKVCRPMGPSTSLHLSHSRNKVCPSPRSWQMSHKFESEMPSVDY